jgi:rSAM/selenodomain-associated transferase 2
MQPCLTREGGTVRLSVVVPTLNEATQIEATLAAATSAVPGAELVIVDGGSTDGTLARLPSHARAIVARRGRARQMNAGAAIATGDTLLFLHADTRLPNAAGDAIRAALVNKRVIGGGFALRFDTHGPLYRLIGDSTTARSRLRQVFTGDQAIFVRADVFHTIGGFADIPLMEDLALCRSLRERGLLATVTPPVIVSARRHRRYGPLRVLATGWVYQLLYALGVPPFALHRLYYGRPPEP